MTAHRKTPYELAVQVLDATPLLNEARNAAVYGPMDDAQSLLTGMDADGNLCTVDPDRAIALLRQAVDAAEVPVSGYPVYRCSAAILERQALLDVALVALHLLQPPDAVLRRTLRELVDAVYDGEPASIARAIHGAAALLQGKVGCHG